MDVASWQEGELLPRAPERVTGKLIYTTYFGFPQSGYFNAIVDIEEVM